MNSADYQHYFEQLGIAVTSRDIRRHRRWKLASWTVAALFGCGVWYGLYLVAHHFGR